MLDDKDDLWPWGIGAVVTAAVIGGLFLVRSYHAEQTVLTSDVSDAAGFYASKPVPIHRSNTRPIPNSRDTPPTIAVVHECLIDGQRVLSDSPCGPGGSIREVAAPNRMDAQDTSILYRRTPQRAHRPEPSGAAWSNTKPAECEFIEERIDAINARMRRGYRSWEGGMLREELRQLSERRHELRCIR